MQVQFVIEAVRGGAAGKRALWKEIVDDAAAGFLDIADRLAQQNGGLEQQSLTAIVLLAQFVARDGRGRDPADRQVLQQQEPLPVAQ